MSYNPLKNPLNLKAIDMNDPCSLRSQTPLDKAPAQVFSKEKELFRADPVGLVKGGLLKIKDKDGNLRALVPNKGQSQIVEEIQAARRARRPVRLVILKGRQIGCSTLIEGILYAFCSQRAYQNALILADDEEGAKYIFEMSQTYHEMLTEDQPHLAPQVKRSTESKLEFVQKKSLIMIQTAANKKAGRKYTFRLVHGSEVAFWPAFANTHKAVSQSVPDKPETIIVYETTANGVNDFCKFWRRIKRLKKMGQTEWVPIFISWKDHDEYQRKFMTDSEKNHFQSTLSKDEKDVMARHELSLEQLNWRRWKVDNDFNGSVDDFQVEYPLTDDEAFKSTGKAVFTDQMLKSQEGFVDKPRLVGEISMVDRRPLFSVFKDGNLKIYEGPKQGHRYVIGADSCEVAAHQDYACAQVIDRTTWRQVAVLHGHIAPDIFGEQLFALGAWYHWALLVPEVNGPGLVTVLKLRDLFYPNLYHRKSIKATDFGEVQETEELGWHNNSKTKPLAVNSAQEALRNILITLHDEDTLDELRTFTVQGVNKDGYVSYGAEDGFNDDRAISLMIALAVARELPDNGGSQSRHDSSPMSNRITGY